MKAYLLIGLIFYCFCAYKNPKSFVGASAMAIGRGILFGFFLWPLAVMFIFSQGDEWP